MKCNEKGVISPSEYFFFSEDMNLSKYYYHISVLGHFYCNGSYNIERSGGVSPLLCCILDGTLNIDIQDAHKAAHKGQIILLNCSKYHRYYCDTGCEFLFAHFSGKDALEITDFLIGQNGDMIFSDTDRQIENILTNCLNNLRKTAEASVYSLSCMISEILSYLPANKPVSALQSETHPALIAAQQYIRSNLTNPVTLDDIAANTHISKYHLCKLFRDQLSISPIEYMSQAKINLAETMLLTTNSSISKIAEDLCYSSSAAFINAFKLRKGITPYQYRKTVT